MEKQVESAWNELSLKNVLAALGLLSTAVTTVSTIHGAAFTPITRWIILAGGCFCAITASRLQPNRRKSVIVDHQGESFDRGLDASKDGQATELYSAVAALLFMVLAIDIGFTFFQVPVNIDKIRYWTGGCHGLLRSSGELKPWIRSLEGVAPVSYGDSTEKNLRLKGVAISGSGVIQPKQGSGDITVHELWVIVEDFREMTAFVPAGGGAGAMEAICGEFLLQKRAAPLPWRFPTSHVELVSSAGVSDHCLPYVIRNGDQVMVKFTLHAKDPGFYLVRCYADVSVGVGRHHLVEVDRSSHWFGFYAESDDLQGLTSLEDVSRRLEMIRSGEWKLFESGFGIFGNDEAIEELEDLRREIREIQDDD